MAVVTGTNNRDIINSSWPGRSSPNSDETINGLAGDDDIIGYGGNDTIDGGAGFDRAIYTDATGAITVNLAAGTASGAGVGSDTFISVEAARGSNFADTYNAVGFNGGSTNASSNGTFNEFEGMNGNDTIIGNGDTRVSYLNAAAAVTVNLTTGIGQGTAAGDVANVGTDTISGISQVRGSNFNDTLIGTAAAEQFDARSGNDTINGGGGFDTGRYDFETSGVTVNLAAGTVTGTSAGSDTLLSIEAIRGSNFVDVYNATGFSGSSTNAGSNGTFNQFEGNGGNDTITGNGNTRIAFDNATAGVTVDLAARTVTGDASVGSDVIIGGIIGGATGGVNSIRGSQFADIFYGSAIYSDFSEVFEGRAGNDYFDGRGGFDRAAYGNDTATLSGITVNMAAGTVTGDASIGTDTLVSIESVFGTNFADTYDATGYVGASLDLGNVSLNEFQGMGGNDTIIGYGGATRISYANALAAVTVNLTSGTAQSTAGGDIANIGIDTVSNIYAVRGSQFNDTFIGSGADEQFDGRGGNDSISAGGGFDQGRYDQETSGIQVDLAAGTATGASAGTDTLRSIERIRGTDFDDVYNASGFSGGSTNAGSNGTLNEVEGKGGNDTITGNGNTRIAFYNATAGVTVNLATGTATGDASVGTDMIIGGVNAITGSNYNDSLTGDGNANTLAGGLGDDTIDGGAGNDIMVGGLGNDTYYVSDASDQVIEELNGGTDHVFTSLSVYTLASNVEYLDATGAAAGFNLTGNGLDNIINSAVGIRADYIDGGAGADQMQGFDGADIYIVDNAGDVVIEGSGVDSGYDIVISTANHTLSANVEQLVLQGGATTGTGNATANYLYGGNSGLSLTLNGAGGDDVLYAGLAGGNTMNGGSGVDTLLLYGGNNQANGGTGSDIYFTYTASDVISEAGGDGIDTVYSNHSITIAEDIEQVILFGSATSATSASLDDNNIIYGNSTSGAVSLSGGGGADVLFGGAFNDTLSGGAGVDLLFAFGGANTLIGGDDTDVYYLESGLDTVTETLTGGFDTIYTQAAGTTALAANVEQLILYGAATGGLGNGAANYLYGHIASQAVTLDGAGGNDYLLDSAFGGDVLTGGAGNDLLDLRTGGNDFIKFAASGSNADLVYGFDANPAGGQDIIDVSGRGFSAGSIGSSIIISAAGADTLVTIGADTIQFIGVVSTDISANDFLF